MTSPTSTSSVSSPAWVFDESEIPDPLGKGERAVSFLRRLRLVTHAPSLGGVDTLISEPRYTSHAKMTAAERARIGLPDGFLRLRVGLEDVDDLIADLEQALK